MQKRQENSVEVITSIARERPHIFNSISTLPPAVLFAEWLVMTLGPFDVPGAGPVIDVAGGRGALSLALAQRFGARCMLVDPKPVGLNKTGATIFSSCDFVLYHFAKLYALRDGNSTEKTGRSISSNGLSTNRPMQVESICRMFDQDLFQDWEQQYKKDPESNPLHCCSCLVGLHSDQATEVNNCGSYRYFIVIDDIILFCTILRR
jgi:hypothetical protein